MVKKTTRQMEIERNVREIVKGSASSGHESQKPKQTARPRKPKAADSPRSPRGSVVSQVVTGSNNQVIGQVKGSVKVTTNKVVIGPVPGTIEANPILQQRIQALFNELGLAREPRFGKSAYSVMYSNFKKDFGIPNKKQWTVIWKWPESLAQGIIDYLQAKIDNTIPGRIKKAASKPNYRHTRRFLFARLQTLLDVLGESGRSHQLKSLMLEMFGKTSRADLDGDELHQLVAHFEAIVQKLDN